MKTLSNILTLLAILLVATLTVGCEDNLPEEFTDYTVSRLFSPTGLDARVVHKTSVRLNWNPVRHAVSYTVEFHENEQLDFSGVPERTLTGISIEQLPLIVSGFAGETGYSVRVRAIRENMEPSKWVSTTFRTDPEQIFFPLDPAELHATLITVRWPAGQFATHLLITPGNITRPITAQEVQLGIAVVSGLQGETTYTVRLMNGTKVRGTLSFTTPIDLAGAIAVHPTDDLAAAVAAAPPGSVLALFPGEYTVNMADIIINKSITIRGLRPHNRPVIFNRFIIVPGATDVDLAFVDLVMDGDNFTPPGAALPGQLEAFFFDSPGQPHTVNNFTISGLVVRNYFRSLIASRANVARITNLTIENCVMTDIWSHGGDFIDFRMGHVANLTIRNSTFDKVATGLMPPRAPSVPRVFIRLDNSAATWPGSRTRVLIENNTFFNVSHNPATPATIGTRIIDVRFLPNESTIRNNMFVGASPDYTAFFSERVETADPTFSNNNYFNAPRFLAGVPTGVPKYDTSPTRSTLNPAFVNAAEGNFTVRQDDLIFRRVGDPRWLP